MPVISVRTKKHALKAQLRALGPILAGTAPDPLGLRDLVYGRIGNAYLRLAHGDFLVKSDGGTGKDGVQWDDITPKTKAYSRTPPGSGPRSTLTDAQDRKWKAIYVKTLSRLRLQMGEMAARGEAARIAWAVLKKDGAKTKLDLYGNKKFKIGVVSGSLLASLTPGTGPAPSGAPGQVFRIDGRGVTVGSEVKHADGFAAKRPIFPREFTPEYQAEILREAKVGIVEAVGRMTAGR